MSTPGFSRACIALAGALAASGCHEAAKRTPERASASAVASFALPVPSAAPGEPVANVDRGRELYGRMCAVCHGAHGEGYRADAAPALAQPDFLASVSDEFLDFAIAIGRARTPMSAWRTDQGGPLSAADIKSIIAFLRTWGGPKATLDESNVHGDIPRGKAIFASKCESCHGKNAKSVHILNRQWLTYAKPAFTRYAIAKGRPPTPMEGFAESLGKDGVEDVLGYLRSLPAWLVPGELVGSSRPPPIPLGPLPLNPHGPLPHGFRPFPAATSLAVIWRELRRRARVGIIDARAPSDYALSHIEGAVSVPFYDPTPYLDALPRNEWLVCYCACPHSESGALAQQLLDAGFTKVALLDEGFNAWTAAKHPTRTGTLP